MHSITFQLTSILVLGIGAQWLAWKLRLPSIILLLVAGFLAGPVFHWVDTDALLGELLFPVISLAVGLILFEGGLSLKLVELRKVGGVVVCLVTLGRWSPGWWRRRLPLAGCLIWTWASRP